MCIPVLDTHYDELCILLILRTFPLGTRLHFPGFFNVQSYRILAEWQGGVRTEEECLKKEEVNMGQEKKNRRIEN